MGEQQVQAVGDHRLIIGPLQVSVVGLAAGVANANRRADALAGGIGRESGFIGNHRIQIRKENPVTPFKQPGLKRHGVGAVAGHGNDLVPLHDELTISGGAGGFVVNPVGLEGFRFPIIPQHRNGGQVAAGRGYGEIDIAVLPTLPNERHKTIGVERDVGVTGTVEVEGEAEVDRDRLVVVEIQHARAAAGDVGEAETGRVRDRVAKRIRPGRHGGPGHTRRQHRNQQHPTAG